MNDLKGWEEVLLRFRTSFALRGKAQGPPSRSPLKQVCIVCFLLNFRYSDDTHYTLNISLCSKHLWKN